MVFPTSLALFDSMALSDSMILSFPLALSDSMALSDSAFTLRDSAFNPTARLKPPAKKLTCFNFVSDI